MSIEFTELPYSIDALEPHVSAKTLEFHHGKHHKAYVDKLNAAIIGTAYEGKSLDKIIAGAHAATDTGIFNNAAQAWNHTFLWHSMSPNGGGEPNRATCRCHLRTVRRSGRFSGRVQDCRTWAVREWLGMACAHAGRTRYRQHRQCRYAAGSRRHPAADAGCLGACLLS